MLQLEETRPPKPSDPPLPNAQPDSKVLDDDKDNEVLEHEPLNRDTFDITWEDVGYAVKGKKDKSGEVREQHILKNISGRARPGEVLAIMGPSGAGKSTLLDLLAGRIRQTSGSVLVNGKRRTRDLRFVSTYVQQQDHLLSTLTTRETIEYAARLQLPHSQLTREQIRERVEEIISNFGLERCSSTKIGNAVFRGVSGGEKRRVSIAAEMVSDPQIVFLDEPTSGLDSEASYQVVSKISELAKRMNKTVIMTIHQPSSSVYELFDKICLLSVGRVVYFGNLPDSLEFFASIGRPVPEFFNPPEHFLRVINTDFMGDDIETGRQTISDWAERLVKFRESKGYLNPHGAPIEDVASPLDQQEEEAAAASGVAEAKKFTHANGALYQTLVLTERSFVNAGRNIVLYWIRVAMFTAMAIMVGTTWWDLPLSQSAVQDRFSMMFFTVAFLCFMSVAGIPAFIEDKAVYDRETSNAMYGVLPYVIANSLTSLPFIFLIAIVYTIIAYPMVHLHSGFSIAMKFLFALFLSLYTIESIVLIISAAFPIFVVALALAAFLNGFFMVVQGYFVSLTTLPDFWTWAHYWGYQTYGFEMMIENDFPGLTFSCGYSSGSCYCSIPSTLNSQCQFTGQDVLDAYGYSSINYWHWAWVLIGQIVGYRLIFFGILWAKRYLSMKGK